MATLPTQYIQGEGSSSSPLNAGGRETSYAMSGKPRIAITYPDQRYMFTLEFPLLSADSKNALDVFYRNNQSNDIEFNYVKDGFDYVGQFIDLPHYERAGPDTFNVTYNLTAKRVI